METLTVQQLVSQALVLHVDAGKYSTEALNELEEFDRKHASELDDSYVDNTDEDNLAMPEGMNLREMSYGVVPPPPVTGGGPDAG